ncbi:uncharacterized protein [Argopecten irradians]|uniref:uncharacterized protein n=1 Tax=Argopecten irradians TaxID=31199 RepID=UPI003718B3CD
METAVTSDRLSLAFGTASFTAENTTLTEGTSSYFIPPQTAKDDMNDVDESTVTIATDTVTTLAEDVSSAQSTPLTQITTTDSSDTRQSTERTTGMCTRGCPCTQMVWGNTTLADLDPETLAEVLQMIFELKVRLTVDKVTLSTYKARKNSATDKRTSASGIGAVSVVIFVIVITVVAMADVTSFLKSGKRTRRKKDRK